MCVLMWHTASFYTWLRGKYIRKLVSLRQYQERICCSNLNTSPGPFNLSCYGMHLQKSLFLVESSMRSVCSRSDGLGTDCRNALDISCSHGPQFSRAEIRVPPAQPCGCNLRDCLDGDLSSSKSLRMSSLKIGAKSTTSITRIWAVSSVPRSPWSGQTALFRFDMTVPGLSGTLIIAELKHGSGLSGLVLPGAHPVTLLEARLLVWVRS